MALNVLSYSSPQPECTMTIVADILREKADHAIRAIGPHASVFEAMQMMSQWNIGALLVIESGQIVGMMTERDYARKIALMERLSRDTPVCDVMSSPVMFVHPRQTHDECMALMTEHRIRHLPVLDKGELVGLISIGDLVKNIISEQQFVIKQLEHYITGLRA